MKARILVAAATKTRARALADALEFLRPRVDAVSFRQRMPALRPYRVLVWEGAPRHRSPGPFLSKLGDASHVLLILPELDVRWVSYYMNDPRISHFIGQPCSPNDLQTVVEKLATGAIFGLDRYLPPQVVIQYRRVASFKDRCNVLDEIEEFARSHRMRGHIRRGAALVAEELLMNAMYQAPMDAQGRRIFADIEPNVRIRRRTPRPVSLRFAASKGSFYLSVRDRFGSFQRSDLYKYLLRCVTDDSPIEDKKLGAGLGLYQVTSSVSRLVINILPHSVSEFICVLEPPEEGASPLRLLTVTTQRPMAFSVDEDD